MTDKLESPQNRSTQEWGWLARMLATICLLTSAVGFSASLYAAADLYIVLFLAVLFSLFLTRLAGLVASHVGIGYRAALAVVLLMLALLSVGTAWGLGSRVRSELEQAAGHIEEAKRDLRKTLEGSPAFQSLLDQIPVVRGWLAPIIDTQPMKRDISSDFEGTNEPSDDTDGKSDADTADSRNGQRAYEDDEQSNANSSNSSEDSQNSEKIGREQLSQAMGAAKSVSGGFFRAVGKTLATTFGLALNSLIILFVGFFLAAAPEQMRDGAVSLAAPKHRAEVRRVMDCMAETLWRWLVGRFASMVLTGLGIGIALWFLGVPLPLTLGVLTGLLTFIPNIGAAIALGLAMFVALPTGIATVGWVVVVFFAFQLVESYVLTPMIQQYQVSLPPALLISTQALMGGILGFLGALIASPMLVLILVLNREVYQRTLNAEQTRGDKAILENTVSPVSLREPTSDRGAIHDL